MQRNISEHNQKDEQALTQTNLPSLINLTKRQKKNTLTKIYKSFTKHILTHIEIHTNTNTSTHTHTHTHTYTIKQIHTHTHTNTHTQIHTHSYTQK